MCTIHHLVSATKPLGPSRMVLLLEQFVRKDIDESIDHMVTQV